MIILSGCPSILLCAVILVTTCSLLASANRQILVFGGNGFLGSSAVERFIQSEDDVTLVSRGNWYWDSKTRILPKVKHISCDRKWNISDCQELMKFVDGVDVFDAVLDFSGYGKHEIKESESILRGKVNIYVFISTDSVYDVCEKSHTGPSKETDAVRPDDEDEKELNRRYHSYGHEKLEAEEELMKQRVEGGFPFVILRLPDVIGPRDTTYRWWIYHLWIQVASQLDDITVGIPSFLQKYDISFVYSEDVSDVIHRIPSMGPQINDQAINLAYAETITLRGFLEHLASELDLDAENILEEVDEQSERNHIYFYPSVRKGPIDTAKASNLLSFTPTPWADMMRETVKFYEEAIKNEAFATQTNEVLQILSNQLYGVEGDSSKFFEAIEKIYDIELHHFKPVRDEL